MIFEFHGKRLTLLIGSNEEEEREERKIVATIRTKFLLKVTKGGGRAGEQR